MVKQKHKLEKMEKKLIKVCIITSIKKKKAGTSNSKAKSTISKSAYDNMKSGFKK